MIEVIFLCSKSEKDREIQNKLMQHFPSSESVSIWHDGCITPGDNAKDEINRKLDNAHIILPLISSNFLTSDDCEKNMNRALERSKAKEARVIPVRVSSHYDSTPFSGLLSLPRNGNPILSPNNPDLDTVCVEIVKEVMEVVDQYLRQKLHGNTKHDQYIEAYMSKLALEKEEDIPEKLSQQELHDNVDHEQQTAELSEPIFQQIDIEAWLTLLPSKYKELGRNFISTFCSHCFVNKQEFKKYCEELVDKILTYHKSRTRHTDRSKILLGIHNSSYGSFITEDMFQTSGLLRLRSSDKRETGAINLHDISSNDLTEGTTLIVVDDLAWSGHTALQAIKTLPKHHDGVQRYKIIFAFVIGYDDTIKRIKKELECQRIKGDVFVGYALKEEEMLGSTRWDKYKQIINYMVGHHKKCMGDTKNITSVCPLAFYYGLPDCALPLFGGAAHSRILFRALMQRPLHFIPSSPLFSKREVEIDKLLQAINERTKHIIVTGEGGVGKTYLVATAINSLEKRLVFWHSFRNIASIQHFTNNLNGFLSFNYLEEYARQLRAISPEYQVIAQFILRLPPKFLIVLDCMDELEAHNEAILMVNELMKNSPSSGPLIVAIGAQPNNQFNEFKVSRFSEEDSKILIRQFRYSATEEDHLSKDCEAEIFRLGLQGHPIMLALAASLTLLAHDNSIPSVINDEMNSITGSNFAFLLLQLWKQLHQDVAIYLAIASTLTEPCYTEAIKVIFHKLVGYYPDKGPSREFDQIAKLFFMYAGENRTEVLQLPTSIRRIIQAHLPRDALKYNLNNYELPLPDEYSYESLHAACAWFYSDYVPKNHLWDFIPETEQAILSHYHSIHSESIRIIEKLQGMKLLISRGMNIADACRHIGLTEHTYYRWIRGMAAFVQISRSV